MLLLYMIFLFPLTIHSILFCILLNNSSFHNNVLFDFPLTCLFVYLLIFFLLFYYIVSIFLLLLFLNISLLSLLYLQVCIFPPSFFTIFFSYYIILILSLTSHSIFFSFDFHISLLTSFSFCH